MLLVIDNYDSFTYNLVQYFGELGADPQVKRNDAITPEEVEKMRPSKIVISPGPGTPADAGISMELIPAVRGKSAAAGGLFGAPVHWGGVWGEGGASGTIDARQDIPDPA